MFFLVNICDNTKLAFAVHICSGVHVHMDIQTNSGGPIIIPYLCDTRNGRSLNKTCPAREIC